MFDPCKPNVILLTDSTSTHALQKSLGAYKVAHELRRAGFEVAVIGHLHVFRIEEIAQLLQDLVNENTLFVGVSNTFYTRVDTLPDRGSSILEAESPGTSAMVPHGAEFNEDLAALIRERNPRCKLVLGGALAGAERENALYDFLVIGYADRSVVNLARHLLDPSVSLEHAYRSVYGPIVVNDKLASGFDFASSRMRYADHDVILPGETLVIEVGRGCIFRCAFCSYPLNGKKKLDYIRHDDLLVQEFVENYERFGVTRYIVSDDTFNDSVEKCEMMARVAARLPFKLEWWAYLRLDLLAAHPQTVDLLAQSGLRAAFFGIETFDREAGAVIGKGARRERLLGTIDLIKDRYGDSISLHGSFIFGLPRESLASMHETAAYLLSDKCRLDTWLAFPLRLNDRAGQIFKPSALDPEINFLSAIELQPQRFGYTFDDSGAWSNEHCNAATVRSLALEVMRAKMMRPGSRLSGGNAFGLSGLGLDLDLFLNRDLSHIDFGSVADVKRARARQYKALLRERLLGATPARAPAGLFSGLVHQVSETEVCS